MKTGIIGLGLQGRRHAAAIKEAGDQIVMGATDKLDEKSQIFAKDFDCQVTNDWQEIIKQPDIEAVLVCTPPHLHARMAIAVLQAGKHVLCEKPLALNVKEAREIVKNSNGAKLKCGFNLRYHPGIAQAKKMADEGAIGEIMFIRACYGIAGRPNYKGDWRMNKEMSGGGELIDQGVHILDLSRWFLGEFSEVFASLTTNYWDIAPLEDNVFATLKTKKGQTAFCHISWTQWKNLFSFEVHGKEGYLIVEGLGGSYGQEKLIYGKRDFEKPFSQEITEFSNKDVSWINQWRDFKTSIENNQPMLASGQDGLAALKLVEALYQSNQEKNAIIVD